MNIYKTAIIVTISFLFIGCGGGDSSLSQTADVSSAQISAKTILNSNISKNNDYIEVYWDANKDAESYILEYGEKDTGLSESVTLDKDTTRYKVEGLDSDTIYIFRLTTVLNDNTKIYSDTLEVKTGTTDKIVKSDNGPGM